MKQQKESTPFNTPSSRITRHISIGSIEVVIEFFSSKLANVVPMKERNTQSFSAGLKENFKKIGTQM